MAVITLLQGNRRVTQNRTGPDGIALFGLLPVGNYVACIYYLGSEADCNVNASSSEVVSCYVPLPQWVTILAAVTIVVIAAAVTRLLIRRRT